MEDFLNSYITCNTVKEEGWTSFLFYPRGVAINGTVDGVRQGSVRHPAAVKGTATGGQRNGYTDCQ